MKDILVIGGGFFGMYISEYLARRGHRVILVEKGENFMKRASYNNQARIHKGYHYPRSTLTALRSKVSFPKFVSEFEDCIHRSFEKYYAISKVLSKTSSKQFKLFCDRIGLPYNLAPRNVKSLMNPLYVEDVFSVEEFVFDSDKIRSKMKNRIKTVGVEVHFKLQILSFTKNEKNKFIVDTFSTEKKTNSDPIIADIVFNCTYSDINQVIKNSHAELIPLKHELTEIALIKMPDELKNVGITIMDGPFFSFMPFPPRGLHSFSHVRYTPHFEWFDRDKKNHKDNHHFFDGLIRRSAWNFMLRDARRYIPLLSECQYVDSLREIKTILPHCEVNDARPILFQSDCKFQGLYNIMGGKIDNIYDIIEIIKRQDFK